MRHSLGFHFTFWDARTFKEELRPTWWSLVAFIAAAALELLAVGVIRGRIILPSWMHDAAPPVVIGGMLLGIVLLFSAVAFFTAMIRRGLYGYYVQLRKDRVSTLSWHVMDQIGDRVVMDESSLLLHTGGLLRRKSCVYYKYYPEAHSSRPEIKELPLNLQLVARNGALEIVWRDGRKVMALDPHDAVMLLPLAVPQLIGVEKGGLHMAFVMAMCNKMRTAHYGLEDLNNKREHLESRLALTEDCLDDALVVGEELTAFLADRKLVPGNCEVANLKLAAVAALHTVALHTVERFGIGSHRRALARTACGYPEVKAVDLRTSRIKGVRRPSSWLLVADTDHVLSEIDSLRRRAAHLTAEAEKIVPETNA